MYFVRVDGVVKAFASAREFGELAKLFADQTPIVEPTVLHLYGIAVHRDDQVPQYGEVEKVDVDKARGGPFMGRARSTIRRMMR